MTWQLVPAEGSGTGLTLIEGTPNTLGRADFIATTTHSKQFAQVSSKHVSLKENVGGDSLCVCALGRNPLWLHPCGADEASGSLLQNGKSVNAFAGDTLYLIYDPVTNTKLLPYKLICESRPAKRPRTSAEVSSAFLPPTQRDLSRDSYLLEGELPLSVCPSLSDLLALRPRELGRIRSRSGDEYVNTPRYTAMYMRDYSFARMTHVATPDLPPVLQPLLNWANEHLALPGQPFNSALLNWYEKGGQYISAHSDDEDQLVPGSSVFSASFGQERVLRIRKKWKDDTVADVPIKNNTFVLMCGRMQSEFSHEVAQVMGALGEAMDWRVNVTFRVFKPSSSDHSSSGSSINNAVHPIGSSSSSASACTTSTAAASTAAAASETTSHTNGHSAASSGGSSLPSSASALLRYPPAKFTPSFEGNSMSALSEYARDPWKYLRGGRGGPNGAVVRITDTGFVVLEDKYAKAQLHYLVLAARSGSGDDDDDAGSSTSHSAAAKAVAATIARLNRPSELHVAHIQALRAMVAAGEAVIRPAIHEWRRAHGTTVGPGSGVLIGFHAVPSLQPLHLHVLSNDMHATAMKTRAHLGSFTSGFFKRAEDVIALLEAERAGTSSSSTSSGGGGISAMFDAAAAKIVAKEFVITCPHCSARPASMPALKAHIQGCAEGCKGVTLS